ncbi:MAG: outer membrane protein assembly factor BamB family protein [Planctomycetota bacterium]
MISKRTSALIMIVGLLVGVRVLAGDWPHWRGPYLNGSSDEKNLPATWSGTENVIWSASLPGHSSATPVIANGKVFVSSTDRDSEDLLALCLDARSGKELWRKKLGASDRDVPRNNLATPSPVTDGEHVYFMYGSGDLAGLDCEGKLLWSRNIEAEYGNISIKYGYSSSPLLYDDKLFILIQRRHTAYRPSKSTTLEAFILAVDPKTGKNVWKQPRKTDALDESLDSYSSPILYRSSGHLEILVIGGDYVTANDPETGKELWRFGYAEKKSGRWRNISSPVTGEELIFGARPRGGTGLFALKSSGEGTLNDDHVAWRFDGPTPDVCTPLFYKGNLYVLDGKSRKTLTCLDAKTGQQKWQGKLGGSAPWRASVTAADDKLYCISEAAEAVVLAAGDERFNILSRIDMEDKPVQASIAIADGRLFIRTANKLSCIGN